MAFVKLKAGSHKIRVVLLLSLIFGGLGEAHKAYGASAGTVGQAKVPEISEEFTRCVNGIRSDADSDQSMQECIDSEISKQREALVTEYEGLMNISSPQEKEKVKKTQADWSAGFYQHCHSSAGSDINVASENLEENIKLDAELNFKECVLDGYLARRITLSSLRNRQDKKGNDPSSSVAPLDATAPSESD